MHFLNFVPEIFAQDRKKFINHLISCQIWPLYWEVYIQIEDYGMGNHPRYSYIGWSPYGDKYLKKRKIMSHPFQEFRHYLTHIAWNRYAMLGFIPSNESLEQGLLIKIFDLCISNLYWWSNGNLKISRNEQNYVKIHFNVTQVI